MSGATSPPQARRDATLEPARTQDAAAIDALHRLVVTPSLSGHEAAAVGEFTSIAAALGLEATTDAAGNGLALRPSRGPERARIILLGHIDTVPGNIDVRIERGILHGRGSVDAKGPLAAMLLAAADATIEEGVALEVIAAVGEETAASPGARFIAPRRTPAACIIGEPSGWDGVTLGYKGRLRLALEVSGPAAHSAGPGGSACDVAHEWWARTRAEAEGGNLIDQPEFDAVRGSILSTRSLDDGMAQRAWISAGFRLPTSMAPGACEAIARRIAADLGSAHPGLALSLRIDGRETAHLSDRNDPVARALSAAIRACGGTPRPKRKTGTSDMNVVAPIWRCPIAAYGPGDSRLDHTPDEHLVLEEYLASIRVLRAALASLSAEVAATA